jgi:hypothetical protein
MRIDVETDYLKRFECIENYIELSIFEYQLISNKNPSIKLIPNVTEVFI